MIDDSPSPLPQANLLELNAQGIFPGPKETMTAFQQRATRLLKQKATEPQENSTSSLSAVDTLYGVKPEWVKVNYSNQELRWWHGGCTWFHEEDGQIVDTTIQLPKTLQSKSSLWGIYSRDEILTHEYVHVGRMTFPDSMYEEVLAYETSPHWFRRLLGPIGAAGMAVMACFVTLAACLFAVAPSTSLWISIFSALIGVSPILISAATRSIWKRAVSRIAQGLGVGDSVARAITYRMTSGEVWRVGCTAPALVRSRLVEWTRDEPRWRVIQGAYFR